jgi:hypothetical protein
MNFTTKGGMTNTTNRKTQHEQPGILSLSDADSSAVSGGQQFCVHEYGIGSVNMQTGPRDIRTRDAC